MASKAIPGQTAQLIPLIVIFAVAFLVYANSFSVPFLYDDIEAIPENATIRRISDLGSVFSPPSQTTVAGRPILNLSFAINYAISGLAVWSYHLVNILIHAACGYLIYLIIRMTPRVVDEKGFANILVPLACALIWLVHPVQTESVTYIVQRAESLVALFYLLTLFAFISGAQGNARLFAASVLFCAIGMASKEVMITAPGVVLLFDKIFLSGSFRAAFLRRKTFYAALFATMIIAVILNGGGRKGSAGLGEGVTPWEYARTQAGVVLHYLRLTLWPHPLVFDYGWPISTAASEYFPQLLIILLLIVVSFAAAWRNYLSGFAGAWFFIILAPSSSIIPIVTQVAAEHRLYLPSAGIIALLVFGGYRAARFWLGEPRASRIGWAVAIIVIVSLGTVTFIRNREFQTAVSIWNDTVKKRPRNSRAQYNLARALEEAGRPQEAVARYQTALRLKPDYAEAHSNLGLFYYRELKPEPALSHFDAAIRAKANFAQAHNNKAMVLAAMNRADEARAEYETAIRLNPAYGEAHFNYGNLLMGAGSTAEGISHYRKAVEINPSFAPGYLNLGLALEQSGDRAGAEAAYRAALRARPDYPRAQEMLSRLLAETGRR